MSAIKFSTALFVLAAAVEYCYSDEDPNLIWFQGWTATDQYIASVVNATGILTGATVCSKDGDCRSNEICVMPNQCGRGICYCEPPKYKTGNTCNPPTTTTSTSTTSTTSTTTTSTTTTSTTSSSTTTSTSSSTTSTTTTTTTTTTLPPVNYYDICTSDELKCARVGRGVGNNVVCKTNGTANGVKYCLCITDRFMWDNSLRGCRRRDYGDPCSNSDDCNNDLYVINDNGHKCVDNKCGCNTNYEPVNQATMWAAWGATVPAYVQQPTLNRTYCAKSPTKDVAATKDCTFNILQRTANSPKVCTLGLVCLGCPPEKRYNPMTEEQLGTCVQFSYPAPLNAGGGGGSGSGNSAAAVAASAVNMSFAVMFAYFLSMLR